MSASTVATSTMRLARACAARHDLHGVAVVAAVIGQHQGHAVG
jgi:hypothetical protein